MDRKFIASEIEEYAKQRSRPDDAGLSFSPLHTIAANLFRTERLDEPSVEQALAYGITNIEDPRTKQALGVLLARDNDEWGSLKKRGEQAAEVLGIGYDSLRRRNAKGHRRLDDLYVCLADTLITSSAPDDQSRSDLPTASHVRAEQVSRVSLFLSYARADDQHEGGFVSEIRDQIVSEFRFQTGRDLSVFQDIRGISVGEPWKRRLVEELETTDFLLVFLTPSYLNSDSCRDELDRFFKREEALGRDDLVLPIYYADVGSRADDPLVERLLTRQYTDWRDLRFEAHDSPVVRRRIADLVAAIGAAIGRTSVDEPDPAMKDGGASGEHTGFLERMAAAEAAFPGMTRTLEKLARAQTEMTAVIKDAGSQLTRLQKRGQGSAAKLFVSKRLAEQLEPHAQNMSSIAAVFENQLRDVGGGIQAIAEELPASTEDGIEDSAETMIASISGLFDASLQAASALSGLDENMKKGARLSTTLEPVLDQLSATWRPVKDSPETFSEWVQTLTNALEAHRALKQAPSESP